VSRPAKAHAREGPRGAGGAFCNARTRAGAVNRGAHRRALRGGDGGRGGAARCDARANAREEGCVGHREA
jgi:hypothetical protein